MKTQDIFNNNEFITAIEWAIIDFGTQHKTEIPLLKMIEGRGDGTNELDEANANYYLDPYGVSKACKYKGEADYQVALEEWNGVNVWNEKIINARLSGNSAKYTDTIARYGASVFGYKMAVNNWSSWQDVPEADKSKEALSIVRRMLYAMSQKPEAYQQIEEVVE